MASLKPVPTPPKKRKVSREERERRRRFFSQLLAIGWSEERLVRAGRDQLAMGPEAVRRLLADIRRGWADDARSADPDAERGRNLAVLNEQLRKLLIYPPRTMRPTGRTAEDGSQVMEDVGGREIEDPADLDVGAILRLVEARGKMTRAAGRAAEARVLGAADPGGSELVSAEGEEEEEV